MKADYETSYSEVYAGMSLSFNTTNLRPGFYYQFKIQSANVMGSSELSPASSQILTAVLPSVPIGLTVL
jgi:hypothetical protein